MNGYAEKLKAHLGQHKRTKLGVEEDGRWKTNKQSYPYILPEALQHLNVIQTFRAEFWDRNPGIHLHRDFHHLNSSQAMCFNLFFPFFFHRDGQYADVLLDALGLSTCGISKWAFEKILDKREGTQLDFCVNLKSEARLLFEVKLSEPGFGTPNGYDERHPEKLNKVYYDRFSRIYAPVLQHKVKLDWSRPDQFFRDYQVFRNIWHVRPEYSDQLIFVFPLENDDLRKRAERLIPSVLRPEFEAHVRLRHLEGVVNVLRRESHRVDETLNHHMTLFEEKYIFY